MPIYWAFLTFMLLRPAADQHLPFSFDGGDKVIHVGIFIALGMLFRLALPRWDSISSFSLLLGYSIITEILQGEMHLGRSEEALDLVADMAGILIGFFLATYVRKKMAVR